MASIYVIATFEKFEPTNPYWFTEARIVGFYTNRAEAERVVVNNVCDIWETVYSYAVIEKIEEGLYGSTHERQFYKWNMARHGYDAIEEPKKLDYVGDFTMG